jgi:photosystem II stability/assembly factor-like uncharacterized protein
MTIKKRDKPAILVVELKDLNGRPVSARSKIVVARTGHENEQWRATGKPEAVTRFTFDLPPGDYKVTVECAGFKRNRHLITLHAGERRADEVVLRWKPRLGRGERDEGEGGLIDARLREFGKARSQGLEEFPSDGRARALEQKQRMLDPEVTNAPLVVKSVPDPLPHASLCSIGAWVDVQARDRKRPFARALLKIPYRQDRLGWVDPSTLRVFAVHAKDRRFQLIPDSGADPDRGWAWAYIDSPGVYGLIGLPRDLGVLETVRAFTSLPVDGKQGPGSVRERICNLILCADAGRTLRPPGGFAGSACDLCNQLQPWPEGLPEGRLLGGPPPGPPPSGLCSWVSTGPRNINGRITALAVHPGVANRVWAGTANAGVWRSDDGGTSWTPLMFQEGALEIGALALHLTNPAQPTGDVTIYAATGETRAFNGYRGIGILRSTTSGSPGSWTPTGAIPAPGGNTFTCLTIDLTTVTGAGTSTVVYAGCPGGLYKTTNAGGAWTQILNKNIQSVVLDPTNPAIIYVGVAFEGIYKYDPTTSTWSTFNSGIATPFPQLVAVDMGRSAPHTLYAKLDQTVYKYNKAMNTWQSLSNHGGTTYGYWNNFLAVDPTDSKIVFVGGFAVERTYDGGTTWQSPSIGHEDNHAFAFDAANHFQVYNGNDGGVFLGTYASATDTGTWVKRSNGLTISHLNTVGASPSAPDLLGCGVQDNGTIRTSGGLTWDSLPIGGDGSAFIIDPANPRILYAQLTTVGITGRPYKSTDGGATFNPANSGYIDGPFVGVMVLDPNSPPEPNRVLFVAAGGNVVQRSTNSAGAWSTSSPSLGALASALAVAPSSSAVVFAGTYGGALWRSSDGGATMGNWKNVTVGTAGSATLPPRQVSKVVIHPTDPNTVFVSFSGYNGGLPGHVYRGTSTDGWATNWTWTNITANLPDIPVNALEIKRPVPSPVNLWAGTDTGVFQTTDGGISWAPFDVGLPNVVIADLALNADGDVLRAAAYGYSMWEIRLGSTCPQMDIYVRDNKLETGEGAAVSGVPDPTQGSGFVYWWESVDIKTDIYPYQPAPVDGIDFDHFLHQDPVVNDAAHPNANKLYVQVDNRGPLPSVNVKVKPLWADASMGLPPLPSDFWGTYPNAWTAASTWSPVDVALPFQTIPQLLPHTPKVLAWDWTIPTTAKQHSCMFVVISADDDNVTRSDGVSNDHLLWVVSPNDKHAALRNLHIVGAAPLPPPGGGGGGAPRPVGAVINLHNPFVNGDFFDVLFDPGSLPKGTRVSLLLPSFRSRTHLGGARGQVPVATVSGRAWWHKSAISNRGWKHEFKLSEAVMHDPCCGRPMATVGGLFISGGDKLSAAVVIAPPKDARPGGIYRCALLQRQAGIIIGGSTLEVRIPMLEVVTKRPG